jgi:hypothetical protein
MVAGHVNIDATKTKKIKNEKGFEENLWDTVT